MTTETADQPPLSSAPAPAPSGTAAPVTGKPARTSLARAGKHVLMVAMVVIALYPVVWMAVSSLRPEGRIFTDTGIFLDTFNPENYTNGWNALSHPFSTYLLNSAIVTLGSIIGNLVSCSMAAYAFARLSFRFRRTTFAIMLMSIMLPIHVVIVPQYVIFAQLGWINTFLPLIVPKFLAVDGFFVFLMVQFIRGLPRELDEAARIDGAGHARIFLQIILPLMKPALATAAIFTFIWTWGDFFTQLVFVTDPALYTVPVALRSFIDAQSQSSYGAMFAMNVVSLLPVLLAFAVGQRYLIRGIATTGMK
ncbi:carbohydrate ABC transporter permease [Streptomyces jeddahensis]|uniref:L-arabinose transport system permease protein AraQ n=1 Tax=Streptomyces jeddahensis TaxID=1716141 RepID=A0A177HV81_9ACTN|nr:carbohydrate ABC transporter permease [Streptomyces jeddahensis]OAH14028.1 L-arabinose transport system permease protein AraQ [Streptomyces jeddahensis]